ncbi:MAG: branched-chain amino acid dehydrogenase [Anaerosolibacter sp.]|jgi:acetate CoA/acetoacetate CoA-transferase alpha subunit|uniref:CoA transferase subunit A n=1 Tax=Anaerosolibacter sp. TaxID=1872527 RepID=UPI002603C068|nr:3-oxoacid CoA-transferase subunit A [Anaerosolibacter sp.]MDF2545336.1 branched-chain amino acid dehydrogenase [Anaerosolibacter sp.]
MVQIISIEAAAAMVKEGMRIMVPGFLAVGTAEKLVDALVAANTGNLTLIAISTAYEGKGSGKLVVNKQVKKAIVSYIGANPESGRQFAAGELEVEFVPQGTLVERIRCGGMGLGGVLTPTGVGTEVEAHKEKIEIDGRTYLLEKRLRADVAFLKAKKADKAGNLVFHRAARNINPIMGPAADITIVQADEIVEIGMLDPDEVMMPGIFVDYLVQG